MKRAVFFALLIALLAFGSPVRVSSEVAAAAESEAAAQRFVVFEGFYHPT